MVCADTSARRCKYIPIRSAISSLKSKLAAASTLGHSEMSITGKDGALVLSVVDNANSTSNVYSIETAGEFPTDSQFNFVINIGNLKLIPGDYEVSISSKLISEFKHKEMNVRYWIALEKSSTFGA